MSHVNEEAWLNELRKHPERAKHMDLSKMSNRYLREFADYVDWYELSRTKNMGIDFMREMSDKLDPTQVWRNKHIKQKARKEITSELFKKEPQIVTIVVP